MVQEALTRAKKKSGYKIMMREFEEMPVIEHCVSLITLSRPIIENVLFYLLKVVTFPSLDRRVTVRYLVNFFSILAGVLWPSASMAITHRRRRRVV